ncbi:MAG: GNAT family N-acetyltransferase [Limimaricola soesokkakensis]|uniref:GNAT family N-acetyltransferase n=1 Tax=Limimaricola soesokkakensis TaxID=1343159 RepID=UPI004059F5BD
MGSEALYHLLDPGNAHRLRGAEIFDHAVDPEQLARFLADEGHELVFATVDDAVVGFASGTVLLHPDKKPALFINEVGVIERSRRQGIGTALCGMLIDVARARGCKGVWLATEADNHAARALYRRLEARETRDLVAYGWDGAMDA